MQLEHLNLSARAYHSLKRAGIDTLEQLYQHSDDDLTKIRNMSLKSHEEIVRVKQAYLPRIDMAHLLPSQHDWMLKHIILLGKTGSHAYGTNTADSDEDYKGVCIPPLSYFLGLDSFEGYDKTGGKNFKNTVSDVDVTILHVNKFVRDAINGVPNNIELLFLAPEDYVFVDDFGKQLISLRGNFLSKRVFKKFGGFARSQKSALLKSYDKEANTYDTKCYMHAVRMFEGAIELLNNGTLSVRLKDPARFIGYRNGSHSFSEAIDYLEQLDADLLTACACSILPDEPNIEFINGQLMWLNKEALNWHNKMY